MNSEKNKVGRPNSEDAFVSFPLRVPKSLKNWYDLMDQQDKLSLRKEMVGIIKSYTHIDENYNSKLKSLTDLKTEPIQELEPNHIAKVLQEEDETTFKLRKLKNIYENNLITQEEYEAKKANILDSL
ncbi:SHOCT domain-containing protein [Pedobacter fastidiosus]|uniref:SHOCT domain-containing protein n=1 Tax=Pedobacter fastidiosus TaxID=2765361 RepID=A0ABR7KSS5_9SPHI|nr:SHOCT domain-containing protein [Pedobacter fastidiosus]MBC6111135.1 SHOCT domain-containing protein [Pedobacter fastidiosus]